MDEAKPSVLRRVKTAAFVGIVLVLIGAIGAYAINVHLLSTIIASGGAAGKIVRLQVATYPKTLQDAILTDRDTWLYADHTFEKRRVGDEVILISYGSGLKRICDRDNLTVCTYVRRSCTADTVTKLPAACVEYPFPFLHKLYQGWIRPFVVVK